MQEQVDDDASIRKMADAVAMLVMALKGIKASSKQKQTVMMAAKEAEKLDKEEEEELNEDSPVASRSVDALLSRSKQQFDDLLRRAKVDYGTLLAMDVE